jgi:hypothetical protein
MWHIGIQYFLSVSFIFLFSILKEKRKNSLAYRLL